MSALNTVIVEGLFSALPAFGIPGRLYFATDTQALYYDTGSAWNPVIIAPQFNVVTKVANYLASVTDDVILWNGVMDGSAAITFDTGAAFVGKIWTVKVIQTVGAGPLNITTGNAAEWAGNPQLYSKPSGTSSGGSVQLQWDGSNLWILFYNQ